MQMVSITLRVLSRPDVNHLSKIYQSLGMDYDERVLPSIGNEVLKSIVAQFDAAELITQREVVSLIMKTRWSFIWMHSRFPLGYELIFYTGQESLTSS